MKKFVNYYFTHTNECDIKKLFKDTSENSDSMKRNIEEMIDEYKIRFNDLINMFFFTLLIIPILYFTNLHYYIAICFLGTILIIYIQYINQYIKYLELKLRFIEKELQ